MSEHDLRIESPPTAEELDQARRLAEAIEGSRPDADPVALAVVRLLETVSDRPAGNEIARRRLRHELVYEASRAPGQGRGWRLVAAAAALATVAIPTLLVWRGGGRPTEAALAARERIAREAVALIAGRRTTVATVDSRLISSLDAVWRARLDTELDRQRFTALATLEVTSDASPGARRTRPPSPVAPTPGGVS